MWILFTEFSLQRVYGFYIQSHFDLSWDKTCNRRHQHGFFTWPNLCIFWLGLHKLLQVTVQRIDKNLCSGCWPHAWYNFFFKLPENEAHSVFKDRNTADRLYVCLLANISFTLIILFLVALKSLSRQLVMSLFSYLVSCSLEQRTTRLLRSYQ